MTRTLQAPARYELVVKKSIFQAAAAPIGGEEEATRFLAETASPDATHNCWAWKCGPRYRSSDDGEPGGTAGRPILQAIEMQDFDGVMVVVTRWFGGVKLGAGGLVRAYGGAAAACLREAPSVPVVMMATLRLHVPFATLPLIQARHASWQAREHACTFDSDGAWLEIAVPQTDQEAIIAALRDMTRGQSPISVLDAPGEIGNTGTS